MINQLFRTKFESNITPFIVFVALNAFLGLLFIPHNFESTGHAVSGDLFTSVTVWLLGFCCVAAVLSLLRFNRERSGRLYAQLPVTSVQVRAAYWLHASLYICISSLTLLLIMFFADSIPWFDMLKFTLLYFFHAGVLLVLASMLTSNSVRLIPEEIRKRTVVYFFLATLTTFMFMGAIGLVIAAYIEVQQSSAVNWSLITLGMMALCAALVTFDIHLFRKKDSYLG